MDCRKEQNLKNCGCTYPGCKRKGTCCECVKHHRDKGEIPGCFFSKSAEAKHDRGIEAFIRDQK